jgi:hypothetical protein
VSILNVDVNRALGCLNLMEVGSIADIPKKRLGRVTIHVYIYRFVETDPWGEGCWLVPGVGQ